MNAPRNCPAINVGTSPSPTAPIDARPTVTAGFSWATPPVTARLANTPTKTPIAHAHVMTIQPEFWAFDLLSNTPATTPSPISTSSAVPTTSPRNIWVTTSLVCGAHGVGAPVVSSQGRSYPKVKVRSAAYQPDIAVLCSASSNVSADLGKSPTRAPRRASV